MIRILFFFFFFVFSLSVSPRLTVRTIAAWAAAGPIAELPGIDGSVEELHHHLLLGEGEEDCRTQDEGTERGRRVGRLFFFFSFHFGMIYYYYCSDEYL
jgi:hypothetical protein